MSTGGISHYLQNKFIDHVLRNTPMTSGSETWVALYTTNPTPDDTGTEVPFSNGYARAYCREPTKTDDPFVIGSSIYAYNQDSIAFPTPTGNWGTVTHWGLKDAPTGGNLYFYGKIDSGSGIISNGNQLYLAPYSLELYYNEWYLSNKLLGHVLNNVSYTSPGSSVYGALYLTMPNAEDIGGVEVSGSGYSRQQINNWSSPTSGSTHNISGSIVFCTDATENWASEVAGMCLRDAPVGGNILFMFFITTGGGISQIQLHDKFVLNEGAIKLGLYLNGEI